MFSTNFNIWPTIIDFGQSFLLYVFNGTAINNLQKCPNFKTIISITGCVLCMYVICVCIWYESVCVCMCMYVIYVFVCTYECLCIWVYVKFQLYGESWCVCPPWQYHDHSLTHFVQAPEILDFLIFDSPLIWVTCLVFELPYVSTCSVYIHNVF